MSNPLRNLIKLSLLLAVIGLVSVVAFGAGYTTAVSLHRAGFSWLPPFSPTVPTPDAPTASPSSTPQPEPPASPGVPVVEVTPTGPADRPVDESPEQAFAVFWEVWNLLQQEYYGELPDLQTAMYGAIRGMIATLDDQYTSFIEPNLAAIIQEDATGTFEGIGALVSMREDGKVEIVRPFPGQPAAEAGILAGDRILAVDGQSVVGYGLYEAIALIRGPANSRVDLLIERAGVAEPFMVTVTRARIEIPLVESRMLEGGIGYISLSEFSSTATDQLTEHMETLLTQNPRGIVFDLRNNPGGWLDQAISVSDLFVPEGTLAIERFSDGREMAFPGRTGGVGEDVPLVVLINGGSASASEIVAGAIQDTGRGILLGEQSLGKGSVQRPHTLSDGSELRVTIARWFTPSGRAIHGVGLAPDIEVAPGDDPLADPQLERAVEYLLTGE